MSNNQNLYQQTLDDLELRRARCVEELRKIETAITGLRDAMEVNVNLTPGVTGIAIHSSTTADVGQEAQERYAHMSVRWAVLKFLYEHPTPQKTADISDALLAGGNEKAVRPTVSAVISDMVRVRNEVMPDEQTGGYKLTVTGRSAWGAIVNSPKYINRASSASEQ